MWNPFPDTPWPTFWQTVWARWRELTTDPMDWPLAPCYLSAPIMCNMGTQQLSTQMSKWSDKEQTWCEFNLYNEKKTLGQSLNALKPGTMSKISKSNLKREQNKIKFIKSQRCKKQSVWEYTILCFCVGPGWHVMIRNRLHWP